MLALFYGMLNLISLARFELKVSGKVYLQLQTSLYSCHTGVVRLIIRKTVMSMNSDKLAHEQVVINFPYSIAQLCTHEDTLAYSLDTPYFNDVTHNTGLAICILIKNTFFAVMAN